MCVHIVYECTCVPYCRWGSWSPLEPMRPFSLRMSSVELNEGNQAGLGGKSLCLLSHRPTKKKKKWNFSNPNGTVTQSRVT